MEIQLAYPLTKLNTLRLVSSTDYFISLSNLDQLPEMVEYIKVHQLKFFVLGGGSNLILPENYPGLVIYNQLKGIELINQDVNHYIVKVMAGEVWDDFVVYSLGHDWYGLENLSFIPGTVGASPIQNIGAYGVEVKDFIEYVEVYDIEQKEFKQIKNSACNFSYRNSLFKTKPNYIVIAVVFRLLKQPHLNTSYGDIAKHISNISNPTAMDLRQIVIDIRSDKLPDPKIIGNVGSFFHNPILDNTVVMDLKGRFPKLPVYAIDQQHSKISAGWLIDNLGLKGYRLGNMGVYNKQALVLVNHDCATRTEVLSFAKSIQDKITTLYNVNINIEPIII